jgi:hypothetical protein
MNRILGRITRRVIGVALSVVTLALAVRADAADYFVTKRGSDANGGLSRDQAFLSIQKGVDTLSPGDTLTIGPGEYRERIRRDKLGSLEAETVIRADIPGTVVLRGDLPAPAFRKVDGKRYLHVADFDHDGGIPAVNELDTLAILAPVPSAAEPEFLPGTFHYDAAAKKLYVSSSDTKPLESHRYSVSVIPTHGIYLSEPKRVRIEGLAVTGFSALKELGHPERTMGGVWAIFLSCGKQCVVRDCHAWLNAWGIALNSEPKTAGDNVIERCTAWGNRSPFGSGDMGGLTGFFVRRDVIRDSTAFQNGPHGINIYCTGIDGGKYGDSDVPGNEEFNKSRLLNNVSWGHVQDYKIKTGVQYFHTAEHSVGRKWGIQHGNILHGLIASARGQVSPTSIIIGEGAKIDPAQEFADPENHDYRLQATSRYRKAAPDGGDLGPFPYAENIFYLRPDGDDAADGLSIDKAWKTLSRAIAGRRPGDTLYLEPGVYAGSPAVVLEGRADAPISIRGRGRGTVTVAGGLRLDAGRHVDFRRLRFGGGVTVAQGGDVVFDNCEFVGLDAAGVAGLSLSHCVLTAPLQARECVNVDLRGNVFDNRSGVGVKLDRAEALRYSDHNAYARMDAAWDLGGRTSPPDATPGHEVNSVELAPKSDRRLAAGPLGTRIGLHRFEARREKMALSYGPIVHSVGATTANLEWMTTLPANCDVAWGETPECANSGTIEANYFGTYSLTGLKPGTKYYFRIRALRVPDEMAERLDPTPLKPDGRPVSFTTLRKAPAPVTYYVAPDGDDANSGLDRGHAWRTIAHAGDTVNAGDTVLIAGGTYRERVRIRATGAPDAPITFRCLPGEKVVLDGADKALTTGFVANGKSHLRFDGFYFRQYSYENSQSWTGEVNGEFALHGGRDIQISRCFSDGRGGYTAHAVYAWQVTDLVIRNCVSTNKMAGMLLTRCPNLRIEHCVFARPLINSFVHRNKPDQAAFMDHNIFTDNIQAKAALNIPFLCVDGHIDGFRQRDNCYFIRCFTPDDRVMHGKKDTLKDLGKYISEPLFADPLFAGDPGVKGNPADKSGFGPERLMDPALEIDFDSFFATNPEVVARGMGLEREAFADFRFERGASLPK